MITIVSDSGQFFAKGSIEWGMAGTFTNGDYGDEVINITMDMSNVDYAVTMKHQWTKLIKGNTSDPAVIAKALQDYLNICEMMVKKHVKVMNNYLLFRLITDFDDIGSNFWECEQAQIPGFMGTLDVSVYDTMTEGVNKLWGEYDIAPICNGVPRTDVEGFIKEHLPMFNMEAFKASLVPGSISFDGENISVTFSDSWDNLFYSSACAMFGENLTPSGWTNF